MSLKSARLAGTPPVAIRGKYVWWGVLALLALGVFAVKELPMLDPRHPLRAFHIQVRFVLLPHIVAGLVAFVLGPFGFSRRLRRRMPQVHRRIGRTYAGAVAIAAPLGALIPIVGPGDAFFTVGVGVHSALWFVTTAVAFVLARNRQITQHRQWMVRSYVLTFSFVTTRLLDPIWVALHVTQHQYGLLDVILNLLYLLAADIGLNWRELTTARIAGAGNTAASGMD